jgi:hypothetical protein
MRYPSASGPGLNALMAVGVAPGGDVVQGARIATRHVDVLACAQAAYPFLVRITGHRADQVPSVEAVDSQRLFLGDVFARIGFTTSRVALPAASLPIKASGLG